MTHPTDTAKSDELKACEKCKGDAETRETLDGWWYVRCVRSSCYTVPKLAGTKEQAIAAWNRRSSPPQNDAGVEGLREAVERFIADYDDGDRADAGTNPLMEAHIADLRAALRTPMSELQALGQEFEAGEWGNAVERLGEALFAMSDSLRRSHWIERPENHAIYEKVVAAFQALPSAPSGEGSDHG